MTKDECLAFANEDPLAGWHSLDEETKEYLYKASRGRWRSITAEDKRLLQLQRKNRLQHKEALHEDKEARGSSRLLRYNEYLKYPVYLTMKDLFDELHSRHSSNGAAKYTIAMKVEIVRTQINIHKYVYGAHLPKGCMHSKLWDGSQAKLDMLLSVLKRLLSRCDGSLPAKVLPKIREEVEPHFNPSAFRQKLGVERNAETGVLSQQFYEVYQAGVFTAWRCTYDVGRG